MNFKGNKSITFEIPLNTTSLPLLRSTPPPDPVWPLGTVSSPQCRTASVGARQPSSQEPPGAPEQEDGAWLNTGAVTSGSRSSRRHGDQTAAGHECSQREGLLSPALRLQGRADHLCGLSGGGAGGEGQGEEVSK